MEYHEGSTKPGPLICSIAERLTVSGDGASKILEVRKHGSLRGCRKGGPYPLLASVVAPPKNF